MLLFVINGSSERQRRRIFSTFVAVFCLVFVRYYKQVCIGCGSHMRDNHRVGRPYNLGLGMCSIGSGDEVDYIQEVSEGKEDEMDAGRCSELCQDSDVDDSEFPGCRGGVEDHVVKFLLW